MDIRDASRVELKYSNPYKKITKEFNNGHRFYFALKAINSFFSYANLAAKNYAELKVSAILISSMLGVRSTYCL